MEIQKEDSMGTMEVFFMVHSGNEVPESHVWLLDSGSSNHMTGRKELFHNWNEGEQHKVRLGDHDKELVVAGRGSVAVVVNNGMTRLIHNIQFVPNLAHNLQSMGQ